MPVRCPQLHALGGDLRAGQLEAAELSIPDLRGGFSQVIAALAAQGASTIDGVEIINRGYQSFTDKLTGLGADIDPVGSGSALPPPSAA